MVLAITSNLRGARYQLFGVFFMQWSYRWGGIIIITPIW